MRIEQRIVGADCRVFWVKATRKVYLFPVVAGPGVPAVLYADSGEVDVDALELLVATAGAVLRASPDRTCPRAAVAPVSAADADNVGGWLREHRHSSAKA